MTDGLTGEVDNMANVKHALGTFLRLAWPQRKDIVQAHVRGKQGSPADLMNDAIQLLSELSQSDGRLDDYKRRKIADGSRAKPKAIKTAGPKLNAPAAKANSAIIERKRKPTKVPSRDVIVSYICGEE
ncbi:hypothetical protein ON010_g8725 [Phytophthora cinnamomi]|nr:hypothetical protein ON010_g8725 [Phytophthora cinnamomi]